MKEYSEVKFFITYGSTESIGDFRNCWTANNMFVIIIHNILSVNLTGYIYIFNITYLRTATVLLHRSMTRADSS